MPAPGVQVFFVPRPGPEPGFDFVPPPQLQMPIGTTSADRVITRTDITVGRSTRWFFSLLVAGFVALLPVRADAQTRGGGWGKLIGVVADEQGNPIAGAQVTLKSGASGRSVTIRSERNGRYDWDYSQIILGPGDRWALPDEKPGPGVLPRGLRPGRYELIVVKAGYESYAGVVNIAGDQDTTHNVVLKRKTVPPITISVFGDLTAADFSNAETAVCTNKVLPDFKAAGYNTFSCTADSVSTGWSAGFTAEKGISGKFGLFGGAAYLALGGPLVQFGGTRVLNLLSFQGNGTYNLSVFQLTVGPFYRITNNVIVKAGVNLDRFDTGWEIRNTLQSAGQVVNTSNASGNENGFAVNFVAGLEWYFAGPVGLRVEGQSRRIDDVVKTDVTGLPKDDRGNTLSAGVVVRLRK